MVDHQHWIKLSFHQTCLKIVFEYNKKNHGKISNPIDNIDAKRTINVSELLSFVLWQDFSFGSLSLLTLSLVEFFLCSIPLMLQKANPRVYATQLIVRTLLHMTFELFVWFYQFRFSECQIKVSYYILDTYLWFDCFCWCCCCGRCCCCNLWKPNSNHDERAVVTLV